MYGGRRNAAVHDSGLLVLNRLGTVAYTYKYS